MTYKEGIISRPEKLEIKRVRKETRIQGKSERFPG